MTSLPFVPLARSPDAGTFSNDRANRRARDERRFPAVSAERRAGQKCPQLAARTSRRRVPRPTDIQRYGLSESERRRRRSSLVRVNRSCRRLAGAGRRGDGGMSGRVAEPMSDRSAGRTSRQLGTNIRGLHPIRASRAIHPLRVDHGRRSDGRRDRHRPPHAALPLQQGGHRSTNLLERRIRVARELQRLLGKPGTRRWQHHAPERIEVVWASPVIPHGLYFE